MTLGHLPTEILFMIVEAVVPSPTTIAFPPSDSTTKTLRALCCVSAAVYPTALRLLVTHCLYIDDQHRLDQLLLFLGHVVSRLDGLDTTLPSVPLIQHIRSLYLAPFPPHTINKMPIARSVNNLFSIISPSLINLVIDMPLRSLYPGEDVEQVRPILRAAFEQLSSIEVFCTVRDELFLATHHHFSELLGVELPVWLLWRNLRVLALYNPDLSHGLCRKLANLRKLTTLVLTRADGLVDGADFKNDWAFQNRLPNNSLVISLVNTWGLHVLPTASAAWTAEDVIAVRQVDVPVSYYADEDVITLCQDWVKQRALRGELEDLGGTLLVRDDVPTSSNGA